MKSGFCCLSIYDYIDKIGKKMCQVHENYIYIDDTAEMSQITWRRNNTKDKLIFRYRGNSIVFSTGICHSYFWHLSQHNSILVCFLFLLFLFINYYPLIGIQYCVITIIILVVSSCVLTVNILTPKNITSFYCNIRNLRLKTTITSFKLIMNVTYKIACILNIVTYTYEEGMYLIESIGICSIFLYFLCN